MVRRANVFIERKQKTVTVYKEREEQRSPRPKQEGNGHPDDVRRKGGHNALQGKSTLFTMEPV